MSHPKEHPMTPALTRLRELAKAATPDPDEWNTEAPASEAWKANKSANAAFIREANPQTVLGLLDAMAGMREALEWMRDLKPNEHATLASYREEVKHTCRAALAAANMNQGEK